MNEKTARLLEELRQYGMLPLALMLEEHYRSKQNKDQRHLRH